MCGALNRSYDYFQNTFRMQEKKFTLKHHNLGLGAIFYLVVTEAIQCL